MYIIVDNMVILQMDSAVNRLQCVNVRESFYKNILKTEGVESG